MTKIVVRTDDVSGFFARAKNAARRADQAKPFDGCVTLTFEDPQRMFAVLSEARRKLMLERPLPNCRCGYIAIALPLPKTWVYWRNLA